MLFKTVIPLHKVAGFVKKKTKKRNKRKRDKEKVSVTVQRHDRAGIKMQAHSAFQRKPPVQLDLLSLLPAR